MFKKNSIYITILILTLSLITIPPAFANDSTATQKVNVIVPTFIGMSINPIIIDLTFRSRGSDSGFYQSEDFSLKNTGNVNINVSVKANGDLQSGNNLLTWTWYVLRTGSNSINIRKDINNIFVYNLPPGSIVKPWLSVGGVPNITPPGIYTTNLTYTAIASQ